MGTLARPQSLPGGDLFESRPYKLAMLRLQKQTCRSSPCPKQIPFWGTHVDTCGTWPGLAKTEVERRWQPRQVQKRHWQEATKNGAKLAARQLLPLSEGHSAKAPVTLGQAPSG